MSSMPVINEYCSSPPSLKGKLISSMCCFCPLDDRLSPPYHQTPSAPDHTPRSPYAWLKSTAHELEIRDRCRGLIGRKGKNRRRHNSFDFRYDPESYSLNFEDDSVINEEELPLNNFAARLPATPDRMSATVVSAPRRELISWS